MVKQTRARTGEEALAELRRLYARHKDGKEGERLTMGVIQRSVGAIKTVATINSWLSEDKQAHAPRQATLLLLNQFLDRCKDKKYLKQIMAKKGP